MFGASKLKMDHVTLTTPRHALSEVACHAFAITYYGQPNYLPNLMCLYRLGK